MCMKGALFFEWLLEEVIQLRCDGDNNPALKQLGDTFKLKGNSFYGKMIKAPVKHEKMTFMTNKALVDKSFRSPFFEDLEDIHGAFEIREYKHRVTIARPYKCGIAIYQLANTSATSPTNMDTNSLYMAILGTLIDKIVRNMTMAEKLSSYQHQCTMTELCVFSRPSFRA